MNAIVVYESLWGNTAAVAHAIAEGIVQQFYPAALASRELLEATQAWLDANREAPAALVRLVSENRDSIARALRAQERDAAGPQG